MNRKVTLCWLVISAFSGVALADDTARASLGDSRLTAGDSVAIEEPVDGHAFVAAGRVTVRERIERSAFLTGGDITVSAPVGRNLYVAGGDIRIDGPVGGKLRAAGGKIRVSREARIDGDASLAGGDLDVDGNVRGDLQLFGESLTINGVVEGDVELAGETIRIGPDARIAGELEYRKGADLRVDPAAQIAGGVDEVQRSDRPWGRRLFHGGPFAGGVSVSFGMVLLGALLILLAPRFTREAAGLVRRDPWNSAGMGFVMLIGVPFVVVLLLVTIIGIPLALLMAFGYMALLLLGYLVAAIFVGDLALERVNAAKLELPWWRVLFMFFAMVALGIVKAVPLVGGLAIAILFCVGIGAFTIRSWTGFRPAAA